MQPVCGVCRKQVIRWTKRNSAEPNGTKSGTQRDPEEVLSETQGVPFSPLFGGEWGRRSACPPIASKLRNAKAWKREGAEREGAKRKGVKRKA